MFGKYELLTRLAVGGMAELFLVRPVDSEHPRKKMVLKCILPHLARQQEFVEMFLDEAYLVEHLEHPNVIRVFEVGRLKNQHYIAMEYIPGQTLRDLQKRLFAHERHKTRVPYAFCAKLVEQIASGLEYVHNVTNQRGQPLELIHRDVSPTNILISYDGEVKLIDFGIANARERAHKTKVGTLKGRLSYMSPEQLSYHPLDQRSDLFSLGVVLYELTTNKRLFSRETDAGTIQAVLSKQIKPPTEFCDGFPPKLEAIILRALARDRNHRFRSAKEMQAELTAFIEEEAPGLGASEIVAFMSELFPEEKAKELREDYPSESAFLSGYVFSDDVASTNSPGELMAPGGFQPLPAHAFTQEFSEHDSNSFADRDSFPFPSKNFREGSSGISSSDFLDQFGGPKTRKPLLYNWMTWAVLLILAGGGVWAAQAGWLGVWGSQKSAGEGSTLSAAEKLKLQIRKYLQQNDYVNADALLQKYLLFKESDKQKKWVTKVQKHTEMGMKLNVVLSLYKQGKYQKSQELFKSFKQKYKQEKQLSVQFPQIRTIRKMFAILQASAPRKIPKKEVVQDTPKDNKLKKPKKRKSLRIAKTRRKGKRSGDSRSRKSKHGKRKKRRIKRRQKKQPEVRWVKG